MGLQGRDGTELMPLFTGVEGVTTARVVAAEEMLVAVGCKPSVCGSAGRTVCG